MYVNNAHMVKYNNDEMNGKGKRYKVFLINKNETKENV